MINGISKITGTVKNNAVVAFTMGAILIGGFATSSYAQTTVLDKHEVVLKMATSQYWDVTKENRSSKKHAAKLAAQNTGNGAINGDDKYLKTKEVGKRYTEFQVFNINKLDNHQVALGLLTNSLDRDTRYDEKNEVAVKTQMTTSAISEIKNGDAPITAATALVPVTALTASAAGKHFVILAGNDYRYMDGKKLVGDEKIVNALAKGKPITESTFFYGLQKAGIVSKNMTVTQFTNMSSTEQQTIMNAGAIAAN